MASLDDFGTDELSQRLQKELPRKRVLIVDRHPAARDALRLMLSALGVTNVTGAGSSAEVLRQVKASTFDIILSDYVLDDGRDGQQLLEELRQQHLIPLGTVFMVITSERGYHNVISVAELAPDDYVIKPFTSEQLQARILKAVFKKNFFAPVYQKLDQGAYIGALNACDRLLANTSPFELDVLRLKGEILNALGRHDEAEAIYRDVLARKSVPWARMGLAFALRGRKSLDEAETLAQQVVDEFPQYLSAYDFLAGVQEEKGRLEAAQAVLQQAATLSPNNAGRQRVVGDVAMRNGDLDAAEKAYGKVLERHRGSSLRQVDDYANLSRVMLDKGQTAGARQLIQELKRDWRGSRQGEYAAAVMDSLCLQAEGEPEKARAAVAEALRLHEALERDGDPAKPISHKIAVDLAQACLAAGDGDAAQTIMKKVAAENNDNRHVLARIEGVFARTGNEDAGRALLDQVNREIVELNNRGVLAARSGDLEESVRLLVDAAEAVPSLQFLVNAAKAISALMDQQGWRDELAEQAQRYLQQARARDPRDWRVLSGKEALQRVAGKYGKRIS
ncbi:response regulator [Azospira restricta]|uniref:Response regulator n=1 Tax=Azospira restricta TaxID=404405 RepID=A0A974SQ28_9RHOO|nr:response regulator [Azospira restricta]QRJ64360.1 response regulator [Azospira restricta]